MGQVIPGNASTLTPLASRLLGAPAWREHPADILKILSARARLHPDETVFSFKGRMGVDTLDAATLAAEVAALAEDLQRLTTEGDRVMLALEPGFTYVVSLLACFAAGRIAVPAYPPHSRRQRLQFAAICRDAAPAMALCDPGERETVRQHADHLNLSVKTREVVLGRAPFAGEPLATRPGLALLQYTSGSTGNPKGVMIDHANLIANLEQQRVLYNAGRQTRAVIWLPPYHDMGLGSGILQPIYAGSTVRLMTPSYAMQQPLRWLEAISSTRAHVSGGPPSAFAACIAAAKAAGERLRLDLSEWRTAIVGAEPISRDVLDAFAETFAPYGFRRAAFQPSYGMAEATLLVTGRPRSRTSRKEASVGGRVGCGPCVPEHEVRIVDPETRVPCAAGAEGEIWIRGPSVARGYWNAPDLTEAVFGARLADGDGPWLRTGDLGKLAGGELWVTGRVKDVLIFAGRKVHACDVEQTLLAALGLEATPCGVAAVGVEHAGREALVVFLETRTAARVEPEVKAQMAKAVRGAIARDHEVTLHAMHVLPPLALPRTTSGKIRRQACRTLHADLIAAEGGAAS